jgi:hypothetical protein
MEAYGVAAVTTVRIMELDGRDCALNKLNFLCPIFPSD